MNHSIASTAATALLLLGLFCQCGCVALNIPSQRIADPTDNGGLFGHWRGTQGGHSVDAHPNSMGHHVMTMPGEGTCVEGDCWDGGPLGGDSCESCVEPAAKPPEVPWPRFLPVPTRPVFGSPASQGIFGR